MGWNPSHGHFTQRVSVALGASKGSGGVSPPSDVALVRKPRSGFQHSLDNENTCNRRAPERFDIPSFWISIYVSTTSHSGLALRARVAGIGDGKGKVTAGGTENAGSSPACGVFPQIGKPNLKMVGPVLRAATPVSSLRKLSHDHRLPPITQAKRLM